MKILNNFKKNIGCLEIPDWTNQIFLILLSFICLIFRTSYWYLIVPLNFVLSICIIYAIGSFERNKTAAQNKFSISRILRFWYSAFMILFCFKEIYIIMVELRPGVFDLYLINFDKMLFGFHPTQYLQSIANPVLTEFLQILYAMFYLMPVIYGLELYLWQRYDEFKFATFVIFFGFYLSFFGYLILPSIGPRFTLHNIANLNNELPGLFFTNFLRELINIGESIPSGTLNPELVAQRDAFPSGHTIIIIIITYLSHKIKSKSFYFYLPYSVLLIFATVYMRYHYVVDLLGGAVIAALTILITNFIYKRRTV